MRIEAISSATTTEEQQSEAAIYIFICVLEPRKVALAVPLFLVLLLPGALGES